MSEEAKKNLENTVGGMNALPEQVRTQAASMAAAYANGMADMAAILTAAGKEDSPCPATDKTP